MIISEREGRRQREKKETKREKKEGKREKKEGKREKKEGKRKKSLSPPITLFRILFSMLRRRPSQVPLGAASEAQRALLAAISPSSSSGGRSSSRRKRLALGVAAALAAAALFAVGVVLGVSSSSSGSDGGIAASARLLLKGKLFSGVSNDARRPPGVPRKLGSGVVAVPKGANSNDAGADDYESDDDGPIEAYLVVYSHVDPGWCVLLIDLLQSIGLSGKREWDGEGRASERIERDEELPLGRASEFFFLFEFSRLDPLSNDL